jgi:hypothetical protein
MLTSLRKNFSNMESISAVGMFLSLACAIHCMAFPLIILIAPLTGLAFFENEMLEHLSILTSILIGAYTLFTGYKNHKNFQLIAFFCLAILILIVGIFIPTSFKPWTDALGAFLIASVLFWNLRLMHVHQASCKH